jgi:hypothetical protein
MGNTIIETQVEEVKYFLAKTVSKLEKFLNETTLSGLEREFSGDTEYYKIILSHFRKLLVNCEEGLDACKVILNSKPFSKGAAEKVLYRIYHHCIDEFFSPKNDAWYEDSRSAYTGKNSIKLRSEVPDSIRAVIKGLEGDFQRVREELEYYETDYRTKMIHNK